MERIMERIVVGVDGSDAAHAALEWAVDEARRRDAVVEAIHAWHQPFVTGYAYLGEMDLGPFATEAENILAASRSPAPFVVIIRMAEALNKTSSVYCYDLTVND